jgi:hypothetical protein
MEGSVSVQNNDGSGFTTLVLSSDLATVSGKISVFSDAVNFMGGREALLKLNAILIG